MKFSLTVDEIRLINNAYAFWPFGEAEDANDPSVGEVLSRASQVMLEREMLEFHEAGEDGENATLAPIGDFATFIESLKILKSVVELSVYVKVSDEFIRITGILEDSSGVYYTVSPNQFGMFEIESFSKEDIDNIIDTFKISINNEEADSNPDGVLAQIRTTVYDADGKPSSEIEDISAKVEE